MFDLKIIFEKFRSPNFTWLGNKKKTQKAEKQSQAAQSENGQIVQIGELHQHFEINDIKALAAEGESVPELLENAKGKFALEQAVRQENFQQTVQQANLDQLNSSEPLDKDWFIRWMDVAQSVGKEEVQSILSSILSGEISNNSQTSIRTLELLRSLSVEDLNLFKELCNISFSCPNIPGLTLVVTEPYGNPNQNSMETLGLNYSKLSELRDLGLIQSDLGANHPGVAQVIARKVPYSIGPDTYQLKIDVRPKDDYKVLVINFTKVGLEIRDCLELETNQRYVDKFNEWLKEFFPKLEPE